MNVNHSYAEVPATTQEAMATEDHHHQIEPESSETHTLAGAEASAAPIVAAPKLVGPFLLSIPQNLTSQPRIGYLS